MVYATKLRFHSLPTLVSFTPSVKARYTKLSSRTRPLVLFRYAHFVSIFYQKLSSPIKSRSLCLWSKSITRIMKSKGQRPFSSTRAIRVFWHFLPKIEYWVTLRRPLGGLNMSTGDPSCTLIFQNEYSKTLIKPKNWLLKQQNAFKYREISEFLVDSREKWQF